MIAKNPGITVIKAKEVHKTGVDGVYQRLENKYHSYDAIYVTIDIDVLDPAFAPGTGTPQPGGLTSLQMVEMSMQSPLLFGIDCYPKMLRKD